MSFLELGLDDQTNMKSARERNTSSNVALFLRNIRGVGGGRGLKISTYAFLFCLTTGNSAFTHLTTLDGIDHCCSQFGSNTAVHLLQFTACIK